jgi:hypothetical protein
MRDSIRGLIACFVVFAAWCSLSGVAAATESQAASCSYTISVPSESDIFNTGVSSVIQWFKTGTCSDRVDLDLWRDGSRVTSIASNVQNNGTYNWTVQTFLRTALEYQVRVRDRDDFSSEGYSQRFTILNPAYCGYRVTDPDQSSVWAKDTNVTIRWSRAGTCGSPVDLHLLRNGQQIVEIANRANDVGTFTWRVNSQLDPGGGYTVRIRDSQDGNSYDVSDAFSIGDAPDPCSYVISEPNASTVWRLGDDETISWSSSDTCTARVDLELLADGDTVMEIASDQDDSGVYQWTVPGDLAPLDSYAVRLQSVDSDSEFDVSETFTIAEPEPQDTVYWIEAAARLPGQEGSVWRTDLVVMNLSDDDADLVIRLRGAGGGVLPAVVSGGAQAVFEDVMGLIGRDGKGWLEISSTQPIVASGRIYNLAADGTFGQFNPGTPGSGGLRPGDSGRLLQLRQLEDQYRTNLTFTNPLAADAIVDVGLYDSEGNLVHSYLLEVDPRALFQDLEPFDRRAERPNLGWGFATVELVDGEALLVSASVIDSRTNDATTIPLEIVGD